MSFLSLVLILRKCTKVDTGKLLLVDEKTQRHLRCKALKTQQHAKCNQKVGYLKINCSDFPSSSSTQEIQCDQPNSKRLQKKAVDVVSTAAAQQERCVEKLPSAVVVIADLVTSTIITSASSYRLYHMNNIEAGSLKKEALQNLAVTFRL